MVVLVFIYFNYAWRLYCIHYKNLITKLKSAKNSVLQIRAEINLAFFSDHQIIFCNVQLFDKSSDKNKLQCIFWGYILVWRVRSGSSIQLEQILIYCGEIFWTRGLMSMFHYRMTIRTKKEIMTVRLSELLFLQLLKLLNRLKLHLFREITPKSPSDICSFVYWPCSTIKSSMSTLIFYKNIL